jgi:hypothetical protein
MKKILKYIIIGICVILIISISLIESNAKSKKEIESIFSVIGEKNILELETTYDITTKAKKNSKKVYFKKYALKKYDEFVNDNNYLNAINILHFIDAYDVKDEITKMNFSKLIADNKYNELNDEDFIKFITRYSRMSYYRTRETDISIITYIKSNYQSVIMEDGKNGYYDSKKDNFKDYSRIVDPFGTVNPVYEIGTYKEVVDYSFYGDFLIEVYSRYWYDTPSDDPNNIRIVDYRYKGNGIPDEIKPLGHSSINLFSVLKNGENYGVDKYIININDGYINVIGEDIIFYKDEFLD